MILHYDLPGAGSVLGHPLADHLAEIPDELVEEVLRSPFWRVATEAEAALLTAARPASAKKAVKRG